MSPSLIRRPLGRIFILDFAYISRMFPSHPRLFSLKTKKYLHRHPSDFCLEYTNFMKVGQPKLPERGQYHLREIGGDGEGGTCNISNIDI